jgi:glycosyltransferase involved in cell wall biosynthesis
LLQQRRAGPYVARNRGIAAARGAVVAFIDADCAPAPDWLQRIDEAMADPVVQVIQGSVRFATESGALSVLSDYETEKSAYTFTSGVREIYYAYTNNMAVRRSVFERLGGFDPLQRGADVVFMQRLIRVLSCDAVRYRPEMRVRHLEVSSAWTWFRKLHVYGRSIRGYRAIVPVRPLNGRERLRVYRTTIRRGGYSPARAAFLLGVLCVGGASYELGRRIPAAGR